MALRSCSIRCDRLCRWASVWAGPGASARQFFNASGLRAKPWPVGPSSASRPTPPRAAARLEASTEPKEKAARPISRPAPIRLSMLWRSAATSRSRLAGAASSSDSPQPGRSGSQSWCRCANASMLRTQCSQLPLPPCSSTSGGPLPKRCQRIALCSNGASTTSLRRSSCAISASACVSPSVTVPRSVQAELDRLDQPAVLGALARQVAGELGRGAAHHHCALRAQLLVDIGRRPGPWRPRAAAWRRSRAGSSPAPAGRSRN